MRTGLGAWLRVGRAVLLAWTCLAACAQGLLQPPPQPPGAFGFKSYDASHGLTNPSVTALAQDSLGFLWVGTEDGVFRLEGARMRRFGTQDGLPDPNVIVENGGLGAASEGRMWVATRKGLLLWDGQAFQPFAAVGRKDLLMEAGLVLPGGLIIRDASFRRFLNRGTAEWRELEGLPKVQGLTSAWLAPDGKDLLVTLGSVLWQQAGIRWEHRDLKRDVEGTPLTLLKDRRGRIWVRTERDLVRFEGLQGPATRLGRGLGLSTVNGGYLAEDAAGRIWTNTAGGLLWFDEGGAHPLTEREGLPEGGANVVLIDQEGSLWVGGYGVHRQMGGFTWEGYTRRKGLPAHVVWSILRTRDGVLWAGTTGGLARGDAEGWRALPGTLQYQFAALAQDDVGNLWAAPTLEAQEPAKLLFIPVGSRQPQWIPLEGGEPGENALALAWDPQGFLRVGLGGRGVFRLDKEGARWRLAPDPVPGWKGRPHLVQVMAADAQGGWWYAGSHGVAYRKGDLSLVLDDQGGLPDKDILALAPAPGGQAWVACRETKALCRVGVVDGALKVLETFPASHPLAESPILALAAEPKGVLWVGSSQGLKRWDGAHLECFDRSWGLPAEDCSQNGILLEPNGDVWVGLSVGLAHFRAALWPGPSPPRRVRILEGLDGRNRPLTLGETPAQVSYRDRTLTFRYLSVGYSHLDQTEFQVRLVGLEDGWRDTNLGEARYPNLSAGPYRFEVRAKSPTGAETPVVGQDFRILTPWWQTWWFMASTALLALLALRWGVRWRTRLMQARMVELEAQVHQRTWELEDANKALEEASMVDPLTNLKNRRFLRLAMPEAEARSLRSYRQGAREDLVFLLVDLDHFKDVNDTHGHAAGDEVLKQVAAVLRAACRDSDMVIRWGGEEFLVVAADASRGKAETIAANIRDQVSRHTFLLPGGEALRKTCSIGFCVFPLVPGDPGRHPWEQAVEAADQCLYAAKKSGRNAWVGVYRADDAMPPALRDGLAKDVPSWVAQGLFHLRTSLPYGMAPTWQD